MILADTGDALVTLAAVFVLTLGDLQVWHIYLIATFSAVFASFQEPAYTASVSLLVPKKDLARSSGLIQLGQALEMLISPILAGILFVSIGLRGIILIDFVTYFFAIGALLLVRIPQPQPEARTAGKLSSFLQDFRFGWDYLRARAGLFGLLWYFAVVNFLLNLASVLVGPLVLATSSAAVLGGVQMASGIGLLAGSLVMSAWGGPKQRVRGVILSIMMMAIGLMVAGLRSSAVLVGAGLFILMSSYPLASGPSQAIFQTKVAPAVQGRVFAMRGMISRSMMPLAFLSAGPLADRIFEPLMRPGGALSASVIGKILGSGAGRGSGLLFVISGMVLIAASLLAYANPHIRRVEDELPDAIAEGEAPPGLSAEVAPTQVPAG